MVNAVQIRRGLEAALVWVTVEFAVRRLASSMLLLAFERLSGIAAPAFLRTAVLVATSTFDVIILLLIFVRQARRERLTASGLGYRFSPGAALVGVLGAMGIIAALLGAAVADQTVFGLRRDAAWPKNLTDAGPAVMLAFLLSNGLLTPAVEEYAWRGYIQLRLIQGYGAALGLTVTVLLFVAKHILVDLSLVRTTTLVVASTGLGVIAHRWGTGASTVTHAVMNFAATLYLVAGAWRL